MQPLHLKFFGAPQIIFGGKAVEPDTRKATALLAYLAVSGQPQTRDTLAVLLYPDYDDAHARGALRRTLHALNKILAPDHLHAARDQISLTQHPAIQVDVNSFNALLASTQGHPHLSIRSCPKCIQELEEAVQLYQGDFLAGFSLRDSSNFDDWQFFTREELRRKFAFALSALAESCCERGEHDKGIHYARLWSALDPLVEEAHRRLMSCYAAGGQRNAALRQYQECVRILEKELGVPPLEETTRLYQSILEKRYDTGVEGSATASQAGQTLLEALALPIPNSYHYPLVGRSRESELIVQSYMRSAAQGCFLTLEGETGIGKTRLAEEFLASVQTQGAVVLKSRCYEGESNLPYSPLLDAFNGALADPRYSPSIREVPPKYLSEAARLVPALYDAVPNLAPPPPLSSPGAQSSFYEGLRQALVGIGKGALPGVIFFDDLQWADSATLDFLAYLVRRLPGNRLFMMAAWRSEDFPGLQILRGLRSESQRSGHGVSLELKRLQPKDIRDLLRTVEPSAERVPQELGERLYLETEGLPFFLVEYLDSYRQTSLKQEEGQDPQTASQRRVAVQAPQRSSPPAEQETDWEIPPKVRDLLRLRVQKIDELGRQLLATAAVIGRSFDFDTLLTASGRSELETIAGLESLLAHTLIEECSSCDVVGEIFYDFTHEKLRRLVYDETSLTRRRLLHRRVADALLVRQRSQASQGQLESKIAAHYLRAGQERLAAEHYKLAGDHARSLYANREAYLHYQSAIEYGYPARHELAEEVGDLQTLLGEYEGAVENYELALIAAEEGSISRLYHKIGRVQIRKGDWEKAIQSLRTAFERTDPNTDPGLCTRILVDWSMAAYQNGQIDLAQELALQALSGSGQTAENIGSAQARNILGILRRSQGDYPTAIRELELSIQIAEENRDEIAKTAALNNLALVQADLGELELAIQITLQALEISQRIGDLHREAALHSNLADLLHKAGQTELAMQHLRESVQIFTQIGGQTSELKPDIWKLTEW